MNKDNDHELTLLRLQVLIIGGGDGGVLREVVKYPWVESVVQCEIDEVGKSSSSLWTAVLFSTLRHCTA